MAFHSNRQNPVIQQHYADGQHYGEPLEVGAPPLDRTFEERLAERRKAADRRAEPVPAEDSAVLAFDADTVLGSYEALEELKRRQRAKSRARQEVGFTRYGGGDGRLSKAHDRARQRQLDAAAALGFLKGEGS